MFALFNLNKSFVGYSEDIPDTINSVLKKKIPDEMSDFTKFRWVGDYDNGSMQPISQNPYTITEEELKESLFKMVYQEYTIDLQNVIIIKQLKKICEHLGNEIMTDDFNKMSKIILKAVDLYEKQCKFYLNDNEQKIP
jgi:hypothetical protein